MTGLTQPSRQPLCKNSPTKPVIPEDVVGLVDRAVAQPEVVGQRAVVGPKHVELLEAT